MPWLIHTMILLFMLPWDYRHMYSFLIDRDGILQTFWLGWPWTMVLLISATQVARITGKSHCTQFFYVPLFYDLLNNVLFRSFFLQSIFHFSSLDLHCSILRIKLLKNVSSLFTEDCFFFYIVHYPF
jgi:hypothetical protein